MEVIMDEPIVELLKVMLWVCALLMGYFIGKALTCTSKPHTTPDCNGGLDDD